ncbi:MAG: cyclodeaminase/cyclohydrolase family protein [Clostridiales bacterium]|nr:cyclodeaminase/cyclohydrolase family protein [Clostridiales bacterium]
MERLTDRSCGDFAQVLASKESVPGGGGAAALAGALGVALCQMAGNFTLGKKKYADVQEDIERNLNEAETLRIRLVDLVEEDAKAFFPLSKAYSIPKDDPNREKILEEATLNACKAPMEMLETLSRAMELLEEMLSIGTKMLVSDVGCGAILCKAAMESAAMNVFINTGSLKDREMANRLETRADELLEVSTRKADRIACEVTRQIRK